MISTLADAVLRQAQTVQDALGQTLFEPVIRLGVTGLSQSGKTVFITSLVANLMDRGRMPHLEAATQGRIEAVYLQPQPSLMVPRFAYETHLEALTGAAPHWPEGTRGISELRLSFRLRPRGMLGAVASARRVHLDIIDYPGEWLLDLGLIGRSYADWSKAALAQMQGAGRSHAGDFLALLGATDPAAPLSEPVAQDLARCFTRYLAAARSAGAYDCTPGRFLLPGDLAGSPALTFAPLPQAPGAGRTSLQAQMAKRFEAYKDRIVMPFFRDHFARIDRQIVLVDVLGAIDAGAGAVDDLQAVLANVLRMFRPGRNGLLRQLVQGRRVERVLFAATKADHIHPDQHGALAGFTAALLRGAADRAGFAGADTSTMAIAALRSTVPEMISQGGHSYPAVRGVLRGGKQVALYPGKIPASPAALRQIGQGSQGGQGGQGGETGDTSEPLRQFDIRQFAPQPGSARPGMGPPHIRLDQAVTYLIADKL
jgi:predicted YcjX-like family ATPase